MQWIEVEAEALSTAFLSVKVCAAAVRGAASPSTGLGLLEIWSAFRGHQDSEMTLEVDKLDRLATIRSNIPGEFSLPFTFLYGYRNCR